MIEWRGVEPRNGLPCGIVLWSRNGSGLNPAVGAAVGQRFGSPTTNPSKVQGLSSSYTDTRSLDSRTPVLEIVKDTIDEMVPPFDLA